MTHLVAGTAFNGSVKVTSTLIVVLLPTVVATTITGLGVSVAMVVAMPVWVKVSGRIR